MARNGIAVIEYTDLHIFSNATINAETYIGEILYSYVKQFKGEIGNNSEVMQDNARSYRSAPVTDYFEGEEIQQREWPHTLLI